jgi:hypothetical protein
MARAAPRREPVALNSRVSRSNAMSSSAGTLLKPELHCLQERSKGDYALFGPIASPLAHLHSNDSSR